jgi:O-antigen/teichoic acid export membrane protein
LGRNYLFNLTYQLLSIVAPVVTTPVVARALGAENLGVWEYTNVIAQYFIMVGTVGLNLYGQREVAYRRADPGAVRSLFWEVALLRVATTGMATALFVGAVMLWSPYRLYYALLLVVVVGSMLDVSWLFQGLEDFRTTVTRNAVVKVVSIIAIVVFVRSSVDLPLYFLCQTVPTVLGNGILWFQGRRLIGRPQVSWRRAWGHLRPSLLLFLPQVSISVYTLLARPLLDWLAPGDAEAEVGYYGQTERIVKMMLMVVTAMGIVALPRVAHLHASGRVDEVAAHIVRALRFALLTSVPLALGLIGVASDFVPWFFGPGFDEVVVLMRWMAPMVVWIGLSNVLGMQFLLPTGRQRQFTVSVLLGASFTVALDFLIIPRWGALGAAVTAMLSEVVVAVAQGMFVQRQVDFRSVVRPALTYLTSGGVMFCAVWGVGQLVNVPVMVTGIQVGVGVLVYAGCLLVGRDELAWDVLRRVPVVGARLGKLRAS